MPNFPMLNSGCRPTLDQLSNFDGSLGSGKRSVPRFAANPNEGLVPCCAKIDREPRMKTNNKNIFFTISLLLLFLLIYYTIFSIRLHIVFIDFYQRKAQMDFFERIEDRTEKMDTLLCIGLDPAFSSLDMEVLHAQLWYSSRI